MSANGKVWESLPPCHRHLVLMGAGIRDDANAWMVAHLDWFKVSFAIKDAIRRHDIRTDGDDRCGVEVLLDYEDSAIES